MVMLGRAGAAVSLLAALCPALAFGQAGKAGVVTTLEGRVTAARAASPQPVALKFKDDVFVNDRVVTGDRSIARLLLGGKAVVTVRERSALTITEVPGRTTIDLDSGKIAVAVAKDKMRPGDSLEVRTPNAVAAVRGTVFVVEVLRTSADAGGSQVGVTTNVYTFADQVLFTGGNQTLNVLANNFASVTGLGVTSGLMTPHMRADALGGLTPTATQPVSGGQEGARDAAMGSTTATFGEGPLPDITPGPPTLAVTPPGAQPQIQTFILPGGSKCLQVTEPGCGTDPPTSDVAEAPAVAPHRAIPLASHATPAFPSPPTPRRWSPPARSPGTGGQ